MPRKNPNLVHRPADTAHRSPLGEQLAQRDFYGFSRRQRVPARPFSAGAPTSPTNPTGPTGPAAAAVRTPTTKARRGSFRPRGPQPLRHRRGSGPEGSGSGSQPDRRLRPRMAALPHALWAIAAGPWDGPRACRNFGQHLQTIHPNPQEPNAYPLRGCTPLQQSQMAHRVLEQRTAAERGRLAAEGEELMLQVTDPPLRKRPKAAATAEAAAPEASAPETAAGSGGGGGAGGPSGEVVVAGAVGRPSWGAELVKTVAELLEELSPAAVAALGSAPEGVGVITQMLLILRSQQELAAILLLGWPWLPRPVNLWILPTLGRLKLQSLAVDATELEFRQRLEQLQPEARAFERTLETLAALSPAEFLDLPVDQQRLLTDYCLEQWERLASQPPARALKALRELPAGPSLRRALLQQLFHQMAGPPGQQLPLPGGLGRDPQRARHHWDTLLRDLERLKFSPEELLELLLSPEDPMALLQQHYGEGLEVVTLLARVKSYLPVLCYRPPLPPQPVALKPGPGVNPAQLAGGALVLFGSITQSVRALQPSTLWSLPSSSPELPPELATPEGWKRWLQEAQQRGLLPTDREWDALPQRLQTAYRWGLTPAALYALALDPSLALPLLAPRLELAYLARGYNRPLADFSIYHPSADFPFAAAAGAFMSPKSVEQSLERTLRQAEASLSRKLEKAGFGVAEPWRWGEPLPDLATDAAQRRLALNLRVACEVLHLRLVHLQQQPRR